PSRPDLADPNDDEAFSLVGMRHIVRHYEHLLAWIVDEPEQVSLEHYDEEELRDIIIYAARTGRTEALDLLIERTGFDVTVPDAQGLTLLDHAQRDKQYEVVHYLINRGAGHDTELLPSRTEEA
ncbi:MAG TPA: ankyrin repeat domain-containing protein, partial [bacterium]|nr:ankyrin repeat domain-containing protein [bacterium]